MINELVKTNKEWLPGGMVDAVDSKSTDRKVVRVRVSGEPPTLFSLFIALATFLLIPTKSFAVRPFVTDDARIIDQGQITSEIWVDKSLRHLDDSPELNALIGASFTQWYELTLAGGMGTKKFGEDFSNPVIQSKFLLSSMKEDGTPGLALSFGLTPNEGSGDLRTHGSSSYLLGLISKRMYDDHLLLHLNIGATKNWIQDEKSETKPFWGVGAEFALWTFEWRGVFEVFSGDPFHPIRTDVATQAGFRWLYSDLLNFDAIIGAEPRINDNGHRIGGLSSWIQFGIRITGDVFTPAGKKGRSEGADGLFK